MAEVGAAPARSQPQRLRTPGPRITSAARRPADNRLPGAADAAMMLTRWRSPQAGNGRHPMASEELATVRELLRGVAAGVDSFAARRW
jgi:hypothetical protein